MSATSANPPPFTQDPDTGAIYVTLRRYGKPVYRTVNLSQAIVNRDYDDEGHCLGIEIIP